MSASTLNPIKKSRGRPPVDSDQVNLRIQRSDLEELDEFAKTQKGRPNRTETIRRILRNELDPPKPELPTDQEINEFYKQDTPEAAYNFLGAIIMHLRNFRKSREAQSPLEVREFVLELFENYGQDLEEHIKEVNSRPPRGGGTVVGSGG